MVPQRVGVAVLLGIALQIVIQAVILVIVSYEFIIEFKL
jgi:hypothetical protein